MCIGLSDARQVYQQQEFAAQNCTFRPQLQKGAAKRGLQGYTHEEMET